MELGAYLRVWSDMVGDELCNKQEGRTNAKRNSRGANQFMRVSKFTRNLTPLPVAKGGPEATH